MNGMEAVDYVMRLINRLEMEGPYYPTDQEREAMIALATVQTIVSQEESLDVRLASEVDLLITAYRLGRLVGSNGFPELGPPGSGIMRLLSS